MSLKHLGPGSDLPVLNKGTLRLYSMLFCPFAQRARLILEHKKIQYETVNITLKKKPEWYVNINPAQEVPTLQFDDGRKLFESLIIAEYLDAAFDNNKVIPTDPFEYAHHKLIVQWFSKVIPSYYKLALKRDLNAGGELNDAVAEFSKNLKDDFFGGKTPLYADFMIWPWLERFDFLYQFRNFTLDETRSANLAAYIERMKNIPACKELINTPENHQRFYETTLNNDQADYDHGLKQ